MADVQVDHQAVIDAIQGGTPEPTPVAQVVPDVQEQVESFTQLDPTTLPQELQDYYKSMQADYTRKTQELAGQRKQYEEYGDFDSVKQKIEFFNRFDSDPQFAAQVVKELTPKLTDYLGNPVEPVVTPPSTDLSDYDLPQELLDKLNSYDTKLAEFDIKAAQAEEQRQLAEVSNNLQRAEMAIRQDNPDYTDDDMNNVYDLLYTTQGDLFAAREKYEAMQTQALARYLKSKGDIPTGVQPVGNDIQHANTPVKFKTIEEATNAATEYAVARGAGA